jgi:hypothetical protein
MDRQGYPRRWASLLSQRLYSQTLQDLMLKTIPAKATSLPPILHHTDGVLNEIDDPGPVHLGNLPAAFRPRSEVQAQPKRRPRPRPRCKLSA